MKQHQYHQRHQKHEAGEMHHTLLLRANSLPPDQLQQQKQQEQQQAQEVKQGRKTYTEQEVEQMRAAGATQGRKGCKALRINMAFSPEVHASIKTMARVRGETVTEFTEYVFRQNMEANKDLYEMAKTFKDSFQRPE